MKWLRPPKVAPRPNGGSGFQLRANLRLKEILQHPKIKAPPDLKVGDRVVAVVDTSKRELLIGSPGRDVFHSDVAAAWGRDAFGGSSRLVGGWITVEPSGTLSWFTQSGTYPVSAFTDLGFRSLLNGLAIRISP